jgi:hypothetical protein
VCQSFAVHAKNGATFAGASTTLVSGDLGVSSSAVVTTVNPVIYVNGGVFQTPTPVFDTNVENARIAAMVVRAGEVVLPASGEIGGLTFTPGTYRSATFINIAVGTVVTLDGAGSYNPVFLFQAGTYLTTSASTTFNLINGANAENVLWGITGAAYLGANSVFEGSILAGTAITLGASMYLNGCALAKLSVTSAGGATVHVRR